MRRVRRRSAAALGLLLAGAVASAGAGAPAYAQADAVTATFGLTGASTSNCGALDVGGADIYLVPGAPLYVVASLAGASLLDLPVSTAAVAGLEATLTVDPAGAATRTAVHSGGVTPVPRLRPGNHPYSYVVDDVDALGVRLPVRAGDQPAGVVLSYTGTVHVTRAAARCGVALSTPRVGVQAGPTTVAVAPPVHASVPVPVRVPVPGSGGSGSGGSGSGGSGSGSGSGSGGSGSGSGSGGAAAPGSGSTASAPGAAAGSVRAPRASAGPGASAGADRVLPTPGEGTSVPAASLSPAAATRSAPVLPVPGRSSPGRPQGISSTLLHAATFPVLLGIAAVLALSLVSAAYARRRLLPRR